MFKTKKLSDKIEIDLDGPQGNAFFILGTADKLGVVLDKTEEEKKEIQEDMTSGDYEHLLEVFEKYYGDYVIMYSSNF